MPFAPEYRKPAGSPLSKRSDHTYASGRNDKMLSRISLPPPNVCVRILPGHKDGLHFPGKYYSRELPCKEVARTRLYQIGWIVLRIGHPKYCLSDSFYSEVRMSVPTFCDLTHFLLWSFHQNKIHPPPESQESQ